MLIAAAALGYAAWALVRHAQSQRARGGSGLRPAAAGTLLWLLALPCCRAVGPWPIAVVAWIGLMAPTAAALVLLSAWRPRAARILAWSAPVLAACALLVFGDAAA